MGRLPLVKKAMHALQYQLQNQISLAASMQGLEGLIQPIRAAHTSSQMNMLLEPSSI